MNPGTVSEPKTGFGVTKGHKTRRLRTKEAVWFKNELMTARGIGPKRGEEKGRGGNLRGGVLIRRLLMWFVIAEIRKWSSSDETGLEGEVNQNCTI